jgi:hypothetical protein
MIRFIPIKNFLIGYNKLKWEKIPIVKKEKILYHIHTSIKLVLLQENLKIL